MSTKIIRCAYEIVWSQCTDFQLIIRDINGTVSITNDVENLVPGLLKMGVLKYGMNLFYYDSTGQLDQILFDSTGFLGFKAGPLKKIG